MVLLSIKAGLRAGEIAKLTWPMVLDSQGRISGYIELHDAAAKKRSGRTIPLHLQLIRALMPLKQQYGASGPVIRSERGDALRPGSVVNRFRRLYGDLGFQGCTSHSGRRTFITNAARLVFKAGGRLRDVQQLAGHRSMQQPSISSPLPSVAGSCIRARACERCGNCRKTLLAPAPGRPGRDLGCRARQARLSETAPRPRAVAPPLRPPGHSVEQSRAAQAVKPTFQAVAPRDRGHRPGGSAAPGRISSGSRENRRRAVRLRDGRGAAASA